MSFMSYKIEDNYLPEEEYQKMKEFIESMNFPWNWAPHQNLKDKDTFHFTHVFYDYGRPYSEHLYQLDPLLLKMNYNVLFTCKANLNPLTVNGWSGKHTDSVTDSLTHKTSIFYFGTNNGVTILHLPDGDVEVNSVDNRLLTFDASTVHSVRHQTDTDRRIVLNINHMRI